MDIWGRLFRKRREMEARANRIIGAAEERARTPQGPFKSAEWGLHIRQELIRLIESVEQQIGAPAYALAGEKQELMYSTELIAALKAHEQAQLLEPAFPLLFTTPATRDEVMQHWPETLRKFNGRRNDAETLRDKATVLSWYVLNQFDLPCRVLAAEGTTTAALRDEIEMELKLESAAAWYRLVDELAFHNIRDERELFADYLQDNLAQLLGLHGGDPNTIMKRMVQRSLEYSEFREWTRSDERIAGTLLWQIGKHALAPLNAEKNFMRIQMHSAMLIEALKEAMIEQLLTAPLKQGT